MSAFLLSSEVVGAHSVINEWKFTYVDVRFFFWVFISRKHDGLCITRGSPSDWREGPLNQPENTSLSANSNESGHSIAITTIWATPRVDNTDAATWSHRSYFLFVDTSCARRNVSVLPRSRILMYSVYSSLGHAANWKNAETPDGQGCWCHGELLLLSFSIRGARFAGAPAETIEWMRNCQWPKRDTYTTLLARQVQSNTARGGGGGLFDGVRLFYT